MSSRVPVLGQVFDLWVSYHNTDDGASSVSLSLPHVVGIDARPWVLEEHSLVISAGDTQHGALIVWHVVGSCSTGLPGSSPSATLPI